MIEEYVDTLGRRLRGPRRPKADLVREVRHSLDDAAEAYVDSGLDPRAAQSRAVAEFGALHDLVPAYQAELTALSVRGLARRATAVAALLVAGADLMWRGAPWTGPAPPAGYQLLAGALDLLWVICGAGAASTLAVLFWRARRGREMSARLARTATAGLAGSVALALLAGMTVLVWSLSIWRSALTWPPMVVGMLIVIGAYIWLGVALRACLVTSSPGPRTLRPAPTAVAGRPETGRR
ncbi:MAG TPA: permease prefix domain 1-containing protein [Micromonosporaceae bacterium]|nr:permease prefix domain 1-containing protein [Micromonosporaceae bacterium]